MNKTLKAISTLSILFFLGSCTENYYNTTNNTYNTYNTVTGDSLSTQESLDTALFGVWRQDSLSGNHKRCFMLGSNGNVTLWKEYIDGSYNSVRNGHWYTVGEMLTFYQQFGNSDYNTLVEYSVSGNNLNIQNSTDAVLGNSGWSFPNGIYIKD